MMRPVWVSGEFVSKKIFRASDLSTAPMRHGFRSWNSFGRLAFLCGADDCAKYISRVLSCERLPLHPALPIRRGSTIYLSRRPPMGRCWCARWRSAFAAPIAILSPEITAGGGGAGGGGGGGGGRAGRCNGRGS